MENFDRAVTDPRFKKQELEKWFEEHLDPHDTFSDDFVVIHSSGSSGTGAIFVYDQKAWRLADVALKRTRLNTWNPLNPTKNGLERRNCNGRNRRYYNL
jgi:hypothetical protein